MCKITDAQIAADGAAVGTALDNLATAIGTTDPTLATSLKAAGDAIVAATSKWKTGDTLAEVEAAEQAAIVVLNSIPVTSPYAPLVAIAFAALNLLIANSQTQTKQTGNVVVDAHQMLAHASTLNTDSPWHGKAKIKHHFLNPPRKDFEDAWNDEALKTGVATVAL